jgi:tetratricopeptide (TPR) repeat protein
MLAALRIRLRATRKPLRHGRMDPDSAAAAYNRGSALKDQRRFADALAAFDQAIAQKPGYAEAYNSRGIVLANLTRFDEATAGFDKAIALKPDYAEAYSNRGNVLQELGRFDDALASFDKAIALQPGNARLHSNRAVVLQDLKRLEQALASLDTAIALKPDYAEAYYNRAIVLSDLNRLDGALANFDKAIALKPDYAAAHQNRGAVLYDLTRLEEAIAAYDQTLALLPGYPEAYYNQSYCYLKLGRFEQGWRQHEWRRKLEQPFGNRSFPQPLWLGAEDISNKTLFVHWEQGIGDTIQFCRYGKLLQKERGTRVVMSVQQPLYRLLTKSNPDIEVVGPDEVPATFDYHCPMMSLPFAFATTLQTVPSERQYIFADDALCGTWAARLPPKSKPRIGLVWSGNAQQKNDRNRSMELATLAPILQFDAHWICLQKEIRDCDLRGLAAPPGINVYGDMLTDFADTAALIELMDLVIAVDTGVAHLACAMGKPVWILLARNADWRWLLDRDDSPWYPTARLFRQTDPRSWDGVVARVAAALQDAPLTRPA